MPLPTCPTKCTYTRHEQMSGSPEGKTGLPTLICHQKRPGLCFMLWARRLGWSQASSPHQGFVHRNGPEWALLLMAKEGRSLFYCPIGERWEEETPAINRMVCPLLLFQPWALCPHRRMEGIGQKWMGLFLQEA